jgi:hypothetical protein
MVLSLPKDLPGSFNFHAEEICQLKYSAAGPFAYCQENFFSECIKLLPVDYVLPATYTFPLKAVNSILLTFIFERCLYETIILVVCCVYQTQMGKESC